MVLSTILCTLIGRDNSKLKLSTTPTLLCLCPLQKDSAYWSPIGYYKHISLTERKRENSNFHFKSWYLKVRLPPQTDEIVKLLR